MQKPKQTAKASNRGASLPRLKDPVERISMSLPRSVLSNLDAMVQQRGFENRSQAITATINREIATYSDEDTHQVMAGTITLFYNNSKDNLPLKLAQIQRKHIQEVIGSLHVHLEQSHTMEVLVVQGPGKKLRAIADELIACKGVSSGSLNLSSVIMPPIHPLK